MNVAEFLNERFEMLDFPVNGVKEFTIYPTADNSNYIILSFHKSRTNRIIRGGQH